MRYTLIILCVFIITSCSQPVGYNKHQIFDNYSTFSCNSSDLSNNSYQNIWNKLKDGFCLESTYSARIEKEIRWFVNNKNFVYRSIKRSEPYLYHVIKSLQRRNMPLELALLPIVESGYQPYAYSRSKAAGIWQFIPATGKEYGLRRNWWYDGRRDILESTSAATHFLTDMYRHFNKDWLLAVASYNTGAGKVRKSMRRANQTFGSPSFWDLNLPRETEIYVPKLLALREIIYNPKAYGFNLPEIPNKPLTAVVKIKHPIDFYTLSLISGLDEDLLYKLNPGFNTWLILPSMQNKILLPVNKVKQFKARYKKISKFLYNQKSHVIVRGDTLSKISRMYNVSVKSLMKYNNLKSTMIIAGKKLKIPIDVARTDKTHITINDKKYLLLNKIFQYKHTVKRYDNWYRIAKTYDVRLSKLLKWNKAKKSTKLKVGEKIIIKMQTPILSTTKDYKLRYVVGQGDTTAMVSSGFGISRSKLLELNSIKNSKYLTAGKNLKIHIKQ